MNIDLSLEQVITQIGNEQFNAFKKASIRQVRRSHEYKSVASRLLSIWTIPLDRRTLFLISESGKLENGERDFKFIQFLSSDNPDFKRRLTADILAKTDYTLTKKRAATR